MGSALTASGRPPQRASRRAGWAFLLLCALASGCAGAPPVPPPPLPEEPWAPPAPGMTWVPGAFVFDATANDGGGAWVWAPGHYE